MGVHNTTALTSVAHGTTTNRGAWLGPNMHAIHTQPLTLSATAAQQQPGDSHPCWCKISLKQQVTTAVPCMPSPQGILHAQRIRNACLFRLDSSTERSACVGLTACNNSHLCTTTDSAGTTGATGGHVERAVVGTSSTQGCLSCCPYHMPAAVPYAVHKHTKHTCFVTSQLTCV